MIRGVHWEHVWIARTHLEESVERVVRWMACRGTERLWLEPCFCSFTEFTGAECYVINTPVTVSGKPNQRE